MPTQSFRPLTGGAFEDTSPDTFIEQLQEDTNVLIGAGLESFANTGTVGIISPDLVSEKEELENPIAATIGHIAGSVAGTVGSLLAIKATLGILPVSGLLLKSTATILQHGSQVSKGTRILAGLKQGAAIGGFHGLLTETVQQVKKRDPDLPELAQSSIQGALFFGLTGGTHGAMMYSPRAMRAMGQGVAFASSTGMINMARGEELDPVELIKDFLVGATFEFVLSSNRRKFSSKEEIAKMQQEMREFISDAGELNVAKYAKYLKETRGVDTNAVKTLTEIFKKYDPKKMISKKDLPVNLLMKDAPTELIKNANSFKRSMAMLVKKVPGLEKSRGGKETRKKITTGWKRVKAKPDKKQLEDYHKILKDSFGVSSSKDLTFGEIEYSVNELRLYTDALKKGTTPGLDLSTITRPPVGLAYWGTPGDKAISMMHARELMDPLTNQAKTAAILKDQVHSWGSYLSKTFMDEAGIKQSLRIKDAIKGKGHPELLKLITMLNTPKKSLQPLLDTCTPKQKAVFYEYRKLFDAVLKWRNVANEYLGYKKVESLDGYVRWRRWFALDPEKAQAERGGKVSLKKQSLGKTPTKLSTEMKRKVDEVKIEDLMHDPADLLADMFRHDVKRIFLEEPRRILEANLKVLGKNIPKAANDYLINHANHVLLGHMHESDVRWNEFIKQHGIGKTINTMAHKFGKDLDTSPIHTMGRFYGKTMNAAFIAFRPDMGIRNMTQRFQTFGLYPTKSVAKAMVPGLLDPKGRKMILSNEAYIRSQGRGFEMAGKDWSPTSAWGKVMTLGSSIMTGTHESNVFFSGKVAHFTMKDLIFNQKYWKHGYADPKRIAGNRPPAGEIFFPSELKWYNAEVSCGIQSTQYDYSHFGTAPFQQTAGGKMLFKFWSWPANYTFNFWREMLHRAWTGRASYSPKGGPTLPVKMRIGALRHIAFSTTMISATAKAGIDLSSVGFGVLEGELSLGPLPSRGTPLVQGMYDLARFVTTKDPYEKAMRKRNVGQLLNPTTYLPASTFVKKINKAVKEGTPKSIFFKPKR